LWRDVLDRWFPACIRPVWGFHQDFDRTWTPTGGDRRFLVFQARMTWLCATIADDGRPTPFAAHARHGLAMLDAMRDARTGACHWEVDGAGQPCGAFARHAHAYGQAFAIFGLSAAAKALGSAPALDAAKGVFRYLERHHRDRRRGGYFELTSFRKWPVPRTRRVFNHPEGATKTFNTHLHLFEAFVALFRLWPDPELRVRLEELIRLFTTDWWIAPGHVRGSTALDGRPIGDGFSYGHDVEFAHLLLDAADALGRPDDPFLLGRSVAILDTALAGSRHIAGGFLDPHALHVRSSQPLRTWWVQAEALACLAILYRATGRADHLEQLERQWDWIRTHQIDREHGGWFEVVDSEGRATGDGTKGKAWKDPYHEARAMILVGKVLGGPAQR
jgi:mannobiose 2-epimerase